MSDEEIAKRCGLKVSDVRAVLNKLHEYGITSYVRERDKDTGWFSYNWTVNVIKLYDVLERRKASGAQRDEEALAYEKSYTFYTCKNAACPGSGQRVPETDAITTTYACNRCGEHLQIFDNTSIIKSLEDKMATRIPDDRTFVKEFRRPVAKPPAKSPPRHLNMLHKAKKKAVAKKATARRPIRKAAKPKGKMKKKAKKR